MTHHPTIVLRLLLSVTVLTSSMIDMPAQSLTLVTESTSTEEVTVSGDLIVNGNSNAASPALEVGGNAAFIGGAEFENIAFYDEGETRLENYLSFNDARTLLSVEKHKWDDHWDLDRKTTYNFGSDGFVITSGQNTITIFPGNWAGAIQVNGQEVATQYYVDSAYAGTGTYAFEFGQGGASSDGAGSATGVNAVSYGAGLAAGNASWAVGTNSGNRDDGYLGPYSSGKNSHAYGEVSRALGNYSFAFGDGHYRGEEADIDQSNPGETDYFPTDAKGNFSFAFGFAAKAQSDYSFAFGYKTHARAKDSFVFGRNNEAPVRDGHVISPGNPQPLDPIFEVGNGADEVQKGNALTLYRDGVLDVGDLLAEGAEFSGDVLISGSVTLSGPQGDISMGAFGAQ